MTTNCCKTAHESKIKSHSTKIILVGNPNVGKSVFFNRLTGTYVEVSNYPGTTVDISKAETNFGLIIDTPGIYGIGSSNDEETVAKEIILKADTVINVVSALSLERDLFLTQQLIDYGFNVIVAVNQSDEAHSRGININAELLEELTGVKFVTCIATKNIGIAEVKKNITNAKKGIKTEAIENYLKDTDDSEKMNKLIDMEENIETRDLIFSERRTRINSIIEKVISESTHGLNLSTQIGKLLLNPYWGTIAAIAILFMLYEIIGVYIAGNLVNFLENSILLKYYSPWITDIVTKFVHINALKSILAGEFGLLTMTVQYILGVLLPLVVGFNLFMATLEDSGYLPRLAVLTDRFLTKIGLNGRAVIPIILGFGCITMATITTRILGSKRERTIATSILALAIPCSAQLGIIVGLLSVAGGLKAWVIYLATIFIILTLLGTILNKMLPGKSSYLFIDLPPMRLPIIQNIISKTVSKTKHFLEEAVPLFLLGSFMITILRLTGGLTSFQKMLEPITVKLLNLPPEVANIFIMGIIRRDFGAAGLANMAGLCGHAAIINHTQILVSLVVITLFVPCIATIVIMFKERGAKEASLIWFGSWVLAFISGGILSAILRLAM